MRKQPAWLGSRDGAWPSVEVNGAIERAEAEWLHTNGAGAYSMSTIALMHTRRHHGALVADLPAPLGRHVIVSHADLTLTLESERRSYRLATHQFPEVAPTPGYRNLLSFAQDPIPRWVFRTGSGTLERTLCLVRGENAVIMGYTWSGVGMARISLRPLMPLRPVNSLMHEHGGMEQLVALRPGAVELRPLERLPPIYFSHDGMFMGGPDWWRRFEYLADRGEHAEFQEDMWTPGVFELPLEPGRTSYLVTSVGKLLTRPPGEMVMEACEAISREALGVGRPPAVRLLSVAAEQFCLDAAKPPMIIAGYPWHAPYTRDFLLALPGLTLARGRVDLAARALPTLLAAQRGGFLPEFLAHPSQPRPKPLPDATLWLFEVARLILPELGPEEARLKRQLYIAMVRSFARLRSNIRRWGWLSADGLLVNGAENVALTWMDAHVGAKPVTPRRGIAIEQQALFTQATGTLATLADEAGNQKLAEACREAGVRARAAFRARFWCHDTDFPYDCVSESRDTQDAWVDATIRPNALIALAVDPSLFDEWQARAIVARVRSELLTPRGIRSLSPLDARYVSQFAGTAEEKELAYHQGTAWTHLLGFYVRAAIRLSPDDEELREELRHVIEGALDGAVILGQIAQLADGDMPHRARGCPAQASSVAELLRALVIDLAV
ncbi:MAG TPA: amylo-alpha-1,6-glucosidase [Polyangiaceae bacterium]|nr:amylo-alpha-1,6-glucosidase [Polyangiaceae bacterium]